MFIHYRRSTPCYGEPTTRFVIPAQAGISCSLTICVIVCFTQRSKGAKTPRLRKRPAIGFGLIKKALRNFQAEALSSEHVEIWMMLGLAMADN